MRPSSLWFLLACCVPAAEGATEPAQEPSPERRLDPMSLLAPNGTLEPWLAWPFGTGTEVKIFQTYGQSEHDIPEQVHMGLDLAVRAGAKVYSPVQGEVAMLFIHGFQPFHKGIGIRTWHKGVEVIVQMLHLSSHSIQFNLGDKVNVGDLVGQVHPWPNKDYPTHLHLAMGLGSLAADGFVSGPEDDLQLGIAWSAPFTENANPLLHLQAPPDKIPPVCVSLNKPANVIEAGFSPGEEGLPIAPFQFHAVEGDASDPSAWKQGKVSLDPKALTGLVDISFAIRDRHTPGVDYALAPLTVRLTIHRGVDESGPVVLSRELRLVGQVCGNNNYPFQIYLDPQGEMRTQHMAFVYHLTSLNGKGGLEEEPTAWATEPGRFLIVLRAGDQSHKHVLIAKQVVEAVGL